MPGAPLELHEREEIFRALVEDPQAGWAAIGRRVGQFHRSLHGEGSIEFCWALVVEAAAALVVDDVCGVLGLGGGDEAEVGAPWEPPAHLAVLVLDLAALPRRVRVAEPHL